MSNISKQLTSEIDNSLNTKQQIESVIAIMPNKYKLDVDDVYQALIASNIKINEKNIQQAIKIMNYISLRVYQGIKPARAFAIIYPERCIPNPNSKFKGRWENTTGKLSKKAIDIKWKRLEASQMYKKIYAQISMSPYIMFATERFKVLGKALELSMDECVPTRDRFQYMKLFLDETREPQQVKEDKESMNININYGAEVAQVNNSLKEIANMLKDKSASEIIDTILIKDNNSDN